MKAKIVRGSGFRGVLDYAHKVQSSYIAGNMSGNNPKDLAKEFGVARQMREDVTKPVWHCALSLPNGERISDEKWARISEIFMKEMGFTELHQFKVVKHEDTNKQHIHIIANRIGLDGSLWYGQKEAIKAIELTQKIEKKFGLVITAGLENSTGKKALTKGEIEMSLRTGEAPAKQVLQNTIDSALSGKQSIFAFMEKLEKANIKVIPNVAKTGKVSGLSFECDGVYFKGSQLGKKYAWNELIKRGVTYEQDREGQKLIDRTEQIKATSSVEPVRTTKIEPNTIGENSSGAEQNSTNSSGVKPEYGTARPGLENSNGDAEIVSKISNERLATDTQSVQRDDRTGEKRNIQPEKIVDLESIQRVVSAGNSDWNSVSSVISDLNAPNSGNELKPDHLAKIKAWDAQSSALDAPAYRITCMSRVEGRSSFNLGKNGDGSEKTYTKQEVKEKISELRAKNAQGYDIYLTPIDGNFHYVVIDDIKSEKLNEVRDNCKPCLIQASSNDNFQAVVKIPKIKHKDEQKIANKLVVDLNEKYGDPKFSGVIHAFRMAGFSNKKAGRNNFITRVVENFNGLVANVFDQFLNRFRISKPLETNSRKVEKEFSFSNGLSNNSLENEFNAIFDRYVKLAKSKGWTRNDSTIDFNVAKEMLKKYSIDDVREALKSSPDLENRHKNIDEYINNTVVKAVDSLKSGGNKNGYKI